MPRRGRVRTLTKSPTAAGAPTQEDRMDGMSLLDVLRGVMLDPAEQAAYNADPRAYLEQYGYDDVDPADLSEAFGLVADTLPPDQAQAAWSAAAEPDDSTADMDDPTFGEAAATGDDSASAADPDTETQGIDADADLDQADDFDSDFDAGGFDDDLADGVDDNDVGGMDDLDDAGPDELDIGSF